MSVLTAEHRPGAEGRPHVVFMSALFAGSWIWDDAADNFNAAGWPVVRAREPICALDARVAGSIERLGDALLDACDEAGANDVVICANSLGGLVAVDLAARAPERVRAIVVSGAPGLSAEPDVGLSMDRRGSVRLDDDQFRDRMLAALFHGRPLFTDEQIASTAQLLSQGSSMVAMARSIRATRTYQVAPALDKVTCPSLYVWGRHDRMTPVEPWQEVVEGRPGAEFVVVPECGHIPMVERVDEYCGSVSEFLERVVT